MNNNRDKKRKSNMAGLLLLIPLLVLLLLFYVMPVLDNIWLSMTNYGGLHLDNYHFTGFSNFSKIFSEDLSGFLGLLIWTILYAACVVVGALLLGTTIAVVLENRNVTVARIFRGIFILPWVIPSVIVLLMWQGLLDTDSGFVNKILACLNLHAVPWLTDPTLARVSVILVMTWFAFPYFIVISQGILQSIPKNYYEAAYMDGARSRQCFFKITLPIVTKTIFPTLIMAFIMQLNQFGIYILTGGKPASERLGAPGATDVMISYIFNTAMVNFRYSLAAAYSVIMFVFVAAFAILGMKAGKRIGNENG